MRHSTTIKVPLTVTQKQSVKRWLKRMRREDANFADAPKARFGSTYIRLEIVTAIALMPWTDTRTSGDLDAYRFKKDVLKALRAIEAMEVSSWWKNGITEAIGLIENSPVGEYMHETPPALEAQS
ncbi:MAG TPA: hypothetical protein VJB59_06935 [Bdellovibrionota bacterium]|nr:hypothetical protein [Bdellovibrionota bacterium]